MNTLFAAQTPSPSLSFVADNPFLRVEYSVVEAELVAMFNVNALSEIGNAKSNVIAVSTFQSFLSFLFYTLSVLTNTAFIHADVGSVSKFLRTAHLPFATPRKQRKTP